MKYEQPFGISDPNASYINGNPSTGTMGSIPPAASIENPQREIVNLITDGGLTPTDADLHQSSRAVQSCKMNYAIDGGVKNSYVTSVNPALAAYAAGQRWGLKVLNTNDGPSTLNINGLGARNIVYPSGGALKGNELLAGGVVTLVDDGTQLQLQNAVSNMLAAPKNYYVNSGTGSDTNYDGLSATVSGTKGPFATIQHAINMSLLWNQNGFNISINVADGTYTPFICTPINGAGFIFIIGNTSNPPGVLVHATAGECIYVQADNYQIVGMKLQADSNGAAPHIAAGIRCVDGNLQCNHIEFGACAYAHMFVQSGAHLSFFGALPPLANYYTVSGDSPIHCQCYQNATVYFEQRIDIVGARNIGTWAAVTQGGSCSMVYAQQNYISGATVTGQKYSVSMNGVLVCNGVNTLPGSVAGTQATGGQVT